MRYERNSGRLASIIMIAVMAVLFGVGMPGTASATYQLGSTAGNATSNGSTNDSRGWLVTTPTRSYMQVVKVGWRGGTNGGIRMAIYDGNGTSVTANLLADFGAMSYTGSGSYQEFAVPTAYSLASNTSICVVMKTDTAIGYYNGTTSGLTGGIRAFDNTGSTTAYSSTLSNPSTTTRLYDYYLVYDVMPTLGSISDNTLDNAQTGVVVTGGGYENQNEFGAGTSHVYLAAGSTWAAHGTMQEQTVTAWPNDGGGTSETITFTVAQGSLSAGAAYLYVMNSDGEVNASGYAVTMQAAGPATTAPGTASLTVASDVQINVSMPYTDNSNGNGNCTVEYNTANSWPGTAAPCSPVSGASPRTCSISGLQPNTLYYVRVIYTDPDGIAGGQAATQVLSATTTNNGTTVGSMSKIGGTTTSIIVSAAFTGDANTNNGCTIEINNGGWTALTTTKNGSAYEATASGLATTTAYDFRATFTDSDGLYGTNPAIGNFATTAACDDIVNDCMDCHSMPPSAGSHNVGAHQGDSTRYACAVCHFDYKNMANVTSVTKWTLAHENGHLDIYTSANINGGIRGGYYSGYRNASTLWDGGTANSNNTCTNTYCHGTSPSPIWGTTGSLTCTSCHGAPPVDVGSHAMHSQGYIGYRDNSNSTNYDYGCYKCHPENQHASGPANSQADAFVVFSDISSPTPLSGTYNVGTNQGTDSMGKRWSNATCSGNLYCHSDGNGGAPATIPTWGTPMTGCTNCHGGKTTLTSGSHAGHLNDGELGNRGCVDCHNATVSGDTTLSNRANHVNGKKDVSMAAGTINGSMICSNTDCHNTGQATPTDVPTPAWGGTFINKCDGCHGAEGTTLVAGAPEYANNTSVDNTRNGHWVGAHVSTIADCNKCHSQTVDTLENIIAGGKHLDGSREVVFTAAIGGTYNSVNKTCSSTSASTCHGTVTPRWGGTLTCADCHLDGGAIGTETADWTYGNGTKATINNLEWTNAGHGRSSGTYAYTGNAAANLTCTSCHDSNITHNDQYNPFRLMSSTTIRPSQPDTLCTSCHSTSVTNIHDQAVVTANMPTANATWTFTPKCVDCHDPHGDNGGVTTTNYNAAMIRSLVNSSGSSTYGVPTGTTAVDFPFDWNGSSLTWNSFVDSSVNPNCNGLCQVCHDAADNVANFNKTTYNASHNFGSVCVGCHGHGVGFAGAGGSCTDCHATGGAGTQGPNSRRSIQADFAMNSHHVNMTGGSWSSMDTTSCAACHAEGNFLDGSINATYHQNGTVELKQWTGTFPAAGNNGTFNVVTYSPTNTASANPFCLGCHNDTNKTATPFAASGDTSGQPDMYSTDGGNSIDSRWSDTGTTYFSKYDPNTYNVVPQIVKAYSPHGNTAANKRGVVTSTTAGWADDSGGDPAIGCLDCHNSHGSDALTADTTTGITYTSNVGKGAILKYVLGANAYDPSQGTGVNANGRTITWSAEADLCWDCHLGDDATAPKTYNRGGPTYTSPIAGYWDGTGRWTNLGTDNWTPTYSYKTSSATATSPGSGVQKGGHFGASSALTKTTPTNQINGSCTKCHDPHGIATGKTNAAYMVPALKGTWMTSPYKEDRAPDGLNTTTDTTNVYGSAWISRKQNFRPARMNPNFNYNNPAAVGNGFGTGVTTSTAGVVNTGTWGHGSTGSYGYFIDDNTFGTNITYGSGGTMVDSNNTRHAWYNNGTAQTITPKTITETDTQFEGLCQTCHAKGTTTSGLLSVNSAPGGGTVTVYVHKSVKGWGATGTDDLFRHADAANHMMGWTTTRTTSSTTMPCSKTGSTVPYVLPAGYRWSVNPGTPVPNTSTIALTSQLTGTGGQQIAGNVQQQFHSFPCSKCHAAHTSNMPRLMKTNCLDVGTSTTNPGHANGGAGEGTYTYPSCDSGGSTGDVFTGKLYTMTCHNTRRSNTTNGGGWNTITGW